MKKTNILGLALVSVLLAACSTQHAPAPVVERNAQGQMVEVPRIPSAAAAVAPKPSVEEHGYYTVKKGDTLSRIALDYGQNYRDLVAWNNLANPNDIKVDQVLRVLPPDDSGTGSQATGVAMPPSGERVALPPAGGAAAAVASAPAAAPVTAALNKTAPHGEKRPYSEAALAELQKPDAASVTTPAGAPAIASASPAAVPIAAPNAVPVKAAESGLADDDAVVWAWPTDGKPSGPYEDAKKGIDIPGKMGQQVMAAASGKVLYAGTMRGYGNLVIVKHSSSLLSAYAHNKLILVKEGQVVAKGQEIAEMGDSDADSVRLHFEVRQQGKPVDPSKFLPTVK
ncbi:MAG: peptidoglycan DD-metalloendopeptidase family protein [Burkholderiaceae bacterium]|nr:peptidoglycan DD-metalloendopeptidase family protein [Burkholderiaceae bacterium]